MDGTHPATRASLRIQWIAASALGWSTIAIVGPLAGFVVGLLQWLVLRRAMRISALWAAAAGSVWWTGLLLESRFVNALFIPDLRWIAGTGVVVGLAQWMLLGGRRDRTLFWLPVNAASAFLSWLVGAFVGFDLYDRWSSPLAYMSVAGALGGAVAGVITGLPLHWLLRGRVQHTQAVQA